MLARRRIQPGRDSFLVSRTLRTRNSHAGAISTTIRETRSKKLPRGQEIPLDPLENTEHSRKPLSSEPGARVAATKNRLSGGILETRLESEETKRGQRNCPRGGAPMDQRRKEGFDIRVDRVKEKGAGSP